MMLFGKTPVDIYRDVGTFHGLTVLHLLQALSMLPTNYHMALQMHNAMLSVRVEGTINRRQVAAWIALDGDTRFGLHEGLVRVQLKGQQREELETMRQALTRELGAVQARVPNMMPTDRGM